MSCMEELGRRIVVLCSIVYLILLIYSILMYPDLCLFREQKEEGSYFLIFVYLENRKKGSYFLIFVYLENRKKTVLIF